MKISFRYSMACLILVSLVVVSCNNNKKKLNERQTLWRKDKIPYGTRYAFENLRYLFPKADIITDRSAPMDKGLFPESDKQLKASLEANNGNTARIIICNSIFPTDDEVQAMLGYVWEGNQLFLSAHEFDPVLLDSLKLDVEPWSYQQDSSTVSLRNPDDFESKLSFTYPGKAEGSYFSSMDSTYTTILGYNEKGKANFIKINYTNGGAIYFHLEPLAFSNFFLLHKKNRHYYELALSQIPERVKLVNWNDYFRDNSEGKSVSTISKSFKWVMSQPPLAWSMWILLSLFVLIYLLGTKRRQRLIPVITPLKNSSLDFVKTIGQLYYQKRDHRNLALKISTHFLDHIRTRYNIPTSHLNEHFVERLAFKAGVEKQEVESIVASIHRMNISDSISEIELLQFNRIIENFYKNT
jgi:hypothetical protein